METSKLGRYELITCIGQGGMAEVQLAVQRGPAGFEKLVVVKLIHAKLAQEKTFVDMLLDEARVAALVKHPNVVDIYDLGEVDGRYFIAMEYLEGEPLLALLRAGREGRRLDPLSTVRLIADTAEGLDAAHELRSLAGDPLGLVHHDVSLGNIVVLYSGQVKLVDFGVARATQHAGPSLKVHGKLSYMAPEKLKGSPGDRRSDIWSLGVVLWEALTLRRLFRGSSERDTVRQVLECAIPAPSTVNGDVPTDVDAIVARALAHDPDQRYATAKDLSDDLESLLAAKGYGRTNLLAQYMQTTFGSHIVARRALMREVATKGTPSPAVIDAAFDEKHSIPGELSIRFKRPTLNTPTNDQRRSIMMQVPAAEGTPIQQVDEIIEARRRNSQQMIAEGTPHSQVTPLPDAALVRRSNRFDTTIDPPTATDPLHAEATQELANPEQETATLPPQLLEVLATSGHDDQPAIDLEIEDDVPQVEVAVDPETRDRRSAVLQQVIADALVDLHSPRAATVHGPIDLPQAPVATREATVEPVSEVLLLPEPVALVRSRPIVVPVVIALLIALVGGFVAFANLY